jgi:hypothetical protein
MVASGAVGKKRDILEIVTFTLIVLLEVNVRTGS